MFSKIVPWETNLGVGGDFHSGGKYYCIIKANELVQAAKERNVFIKFDENNCDL